MKRLASQYIMVVTAFPKGSGMSLGISSVTLPYTKYIQSYSCLGGSVKSSSSVTNWIVASLNHMRYPHILFTLSRYLTFGSKQNPDIVITVIVISKCLIETAYYTEPISNWYILTYDSDKVSEVSTSG